MEVVAIFGIAILVIVFIFVKRVRKQEEPIPPPSVGFDLSPGISKFFKWLYFSISLVFLGVFLFAYSYALSLLIHKETVQGTFVSADCSYKPKKESKDCIDTYKVFEIKYSYKGNNYMTHSSASGVRIKIPSPLLSKNLSIGDNVDVFVDSSNPGNSMVAEEFWKTFFFTTFYLAIPFILVSHSTYLLIKMQRNREKVISRRPNTS